jgi:hypothetical protein
MRSTINSEEQANARYAKIWKFTRLEGGNFGFIEDWKT